jgi:hypothetical protein
MCGQDLLVNQGLTAGASETLFINFAQLLVVSSQNRTSTHAPSFARHLCAGSDLCRVRSVRNAPLKAVIADMRAWVRRRPSFAAPGLAAVLWLKIFGSLSRQ